MLAQLLCERRAELEADLLQTYGLMLDEAMGGAYPATLVASLVYQMPQDCRWRVSYDKDAAWTLDRQLQAGILNNLRALIWGLSDKDERGPEPEPVGPSWATRRANPMMAMTITELMEQLSRPRRGASDGGRK